VSTVINLGIKKMDTTIRLTDETKKKLYKIKGQIESKKGKPSSMDQTINELIKEYQKRK